MTNSDYDNFGDISTGENTKMPGWSYVGHQNGYYIWQNDNYIPMGFSYDFYITQEQYESLSESTRESVLLHCLVLSDEQIETYGDLLSPMTNIYSLSWDENQYKTDCKDRARTSCSSFAYTTSGFTAVSSGDKERLVFFSVPYESGWSATVNGEPVQVEQVSVGFMAVKVPAGESTIVFTYETPGLKIGALISLISVLLLALYLLCARFSAVVRYRLLPGHRLRPVPFRISPVCIRTPILTPSILYWSNRKRTRWKRRKNREGAFCIPRRPLLQRTGSPARNQPGIVAKTS